MIPFKKTTVSLDVPELQDKVLLRYWTAKEVFRFQDALKSDQVQEYFILGVALSLSDDKGNRIVSDDEMEQLYQYPFLALKRITEAGQEMNFPEQKKSKVPETSLSPS
jgi:hypothetical protein